MEVYLLQDVHKVHTDLVIFHNFHFFLMVLVQSCHSMDGNFIQLKNYSQENLVLAPDNTPTTVCVLVAKTMVTLTFDSLRKLDSSLCLLPSLSLFLSLSVWEAEMTPGQMTKYLSKWFKWRLVRKQHWRERRWRGRRLTSHSAAGNPFRCRCLLCVTLVRANILWQWKEQTLTTSEQKGCWLSEDKLASKARKRSCGRG